MIIRKIPSIVIRHRIEQARRLLRPIACAVNHRRRLHDAACKLHIGAARIPAKFKHLVHQETDGDRFALSQKIIAAERLGRIIGKDQIPGGIIVEKSRFRRRIDVDAERLINPSHGL